MSLLILRLFTKQLTLVRNLNASKYITHSFSNSSSKNSSNLASQFFNRSFSHFNTPLLSDKKSSKKYFESKRFFFKHKFKILIENK